MVLLYHIFDGFAIVRCYPNSIDNDNRLRVNCSRKIDFCMPFDMNFINNLNDIIKNESFVVDMNITFKLSDNKKIHEQLLEEAVLDSKRQAELIANAIGQKIVGIIELYSRENFSDDEDIFFDIFSTINNSGSEHDSDKLQAPMSTETELVEVEWQIE